MTRCLIVAMLVVATAAVALAASCPAAVPTPSNFALASYLGRWYEIATTPTARDTFERDCECTNAQYVLPSGASVVAVNNTCFRDGAWHSALGQARQPNASEPAHLEVRFSSLSPYAPYWVLDTDYTSYALVWSCMQLLGFDVGENIWVLSRQPQMQPALYQRLLAEAAKLTGYDISKVVATNQTDC